MSTFKTDAIQAHPFAFPEAALDDLRERLARTRWPERETVGVVKQIG